MIVDEHQEDSNDPTERLICHNCGHRITGIDRCPSCGYDLNPQHDPLSKVTQYPVEDLSFPDTSPMCTNCGHHIFVNKPSQLGAISTIVGFALLIILAPLFGMAAGWIGSFLGSLIGFVLLSIGIWKQHSPSLIERCDRCGKKRC